MAKINIPFNNKEYSIEESAMAVAANALKTYFTTTMRGTGAKVFLNGVGYDIDGEKLAAAKEKFVNYLPEIADVVGDEPTGPAYAMLYNDGTMVFQRGDTPDPARGELTASYTDFEDATYVFPSAVPWDSKRISVKQVIFEDIVSPVSTAQWFASMSNCTSMDLSKLDTAKVTSMNNMFYICNSLTSLDVSSFNTASVTDMSYMFYGCNKLTSLDLSSFNTASVTIMNCMFLGCNSLTSLDLSSFNTANVTNMSSMFFGCMNLVTIYASNLWSTAKVTSSNKMFTNCTKLKGDIAYQSSYVNTTYAKTSGGYLTYKAAPVAA